MEGDAAAVGGALLRIAAGAQLLLKEGTRRIGYFDFAWANALPIGLQLAANPFVIAGLTAYVVSLAVWILVLSRVDVSYAYPMADNPAVISATSDLINSSGLPPGLVRLLSEGRDGLRRALRCQERDRRAAC